MKISVVIPVYGRIDSLLLLLGDLVSQENASYEVVVVDDCSPEDPTDTILARFPGTVLVRNAKNGGPTLARNHGIRTATGDVIVGLDSDVRVKDPEFLSKVQKRFDESPRWTALAFRLFCEDGVTDDVPRWWHPVPAKDFCTREFETDYFSGTAFAFRREELNELGGFSEVLFQYYEEVELALRFMDAGGVIHYVPDLSVVHVPGPRKGRSDVRLYYNARNQLLMAVRCYPVPRALAYLVPRHGLAVVRSIFALKLGTYLRAVNSALREIPKEWQRRSPLKPETWARITELRSVAKN